MLHASNLPIWGFLSLSFPFVGDCVGSLREGDCLNAKIRLQYDCLWISQSTPIIPLISKTPNSWCLTSYLRLCILVLVSDELGVRMHTLAVHSRAVLSCLLLFFVYSAAICPTSGSSGLGSHNKARIWNQQGWGLRESRLVRLFQWSRQATTPV
jgi:hypothetical protein